MGEEIVGASSTAGEISSGRRQRQQSAVGPTPPFACAFRFDPKDEKVIPVEDAKATMAEGWFVWIDLDLRRDETRGYIEALGCIHPEILEDALGGEPATQVARYEASLHIALTACRLTKTAFEQDRTDLVMGDRFLLTLHRSAPHFLRETRRHYRSDFLRFAKSSSFLLYEIWDHLVDDYLEVQKEFEERVEKVQQGLTTEIDDSIFSKISHLGSDLLHFRKVLLPARSVLTDLSTRKSPFISEATMPFLHNMVATVDHVLQDLLVDRDILSESLNLYMSMVGHRTNRVMNRLTVVSVIFLPLTFLCGVYGMNFEVLPELKWEYGYALFWIMVGGIVSVLLWYMRNKKLL